MPFYEDQIGTNPKYNDSFNSFKGIGADLFFTMGPYHWIQNRRESQIIGSAKRQFKDYRRQSLLRDPQLNKYFKARDQYQASVKAGMGSMHSIEQGIKRDIRQGIRSVYNQPLASNIRRTARQASGRLGIFRPNNIAKAMSFAGWLSMGVGGLSDVVFNTLREASRPQLARSDGYNGDFEENPFIDTMNASTSRKRALMAIHNSQLNARAILGNEAMYMHGG